MRNVAKAERERRVAEALDMVRLGGLGERRPQEMSGGQRQRVALARALVIRPTILLLDEPLSNLDRKLREQMRLELRRLQRTLGITTVFVTHDQEEAMTTADRMAVLDDGVLQQIGTPRDLFDAPSNRFVAEFVGSTNLLPGRVDASRAVFVADGFGEIPLSGHGSGTAVSIRPHALVVSTRRDERRLWFDGTVREIEFLGEFTRYEIGVGAVTLTVDATHLSTTPVFERGSSVTVGIDPAEVRVLT
jgi:iron(III) transport system ATP-binding protein